jgi:hypothetical protein
MTVAHQLGQAKQHERRPPLDDVEIVRQRGRPALPPRPRVHDAERTAAGGGACPGRERGGDH